MRKQYHSRPSARGALVWDVDRLVALTANLPRIAVPLTAIRELDESFWFDVDGPPPTCRAVMEHARLIDASDLRYPIILSADGRVMDGMHRVAKAALLGHTTIEACRFEHDPEPDRIGVALDDLSYEETPPGLAP